MTGVVDFDISPDGEIVISRIPIETLVTVAARAAASAAWTARAADVCVGATRCGDKNTRPSTTMIALLIFISN